MGDSVEIDPAWVDVQVAAFAERRNVFEQHAALLQSVLEWLVADVCPTAVVTSRVKAVSSFAGKIIRRIQLLGAMPSTDRFQYELTPDLSAGRIVVHLRQQVKELEQRVRQVLIKTHERYAEAELNQDQFGYRATHLLGKLRIDTLSELSFFESAQGRAFDQAACQSLGEITCEIQLVTLAQNLWEAFTHDRQYKGDFSFPRVIARHTYRIAAMMEGVDESLEQIVDELALLETNVGRYFDEADAVQEIQRLRATVRHVPHELSLIARLVRLEVHLGQYDQVIERLAALHAEQVKLTPRLLSEWGYALCYRDSSTEAEKADGLRMLNDSARQQPHVETLTRIAQLTKADLSARRELWQRAYISRPTDPTALAGFLRHEIIHTQSKGIVALLRPNIDAAMRTLREQIQLSINLPNALYLLAEFEFVLQRPMDSLCRLCQAIAITPNNEHGDDLLAAVLEAITLAGNIKPAPQGWRWLHWTVEILIAIRTARGGPITLPPQLRALAGASVAGPATIIAGGCDSSTSVDWAEYVDLLDFALSDYSGTIVSGGTRSGISQVVGDVIGKAPERLRGFCWLPTSLPTGTAIDERYADARIARPASDGEASANFSPLEPLRAWITLLASGVKPQDVKLIGVNGGPIAAFEYLFAATAGATVGIVHPSGRAADGFFRNRSELGNHRLYFLPKDRETLRAFMNFPASSRFSDEEIRQLAVQADANYHTLLHEQKRRAWAADVAKDPGLSRSFSKSNVSQIEDIERKLARIGLRVIKIVADDSTPRTPFQFTAPQIELLAEMEHGRWVAERTLDGWLLGPDDSKQRTRSQLVPWTDPSLSEDDKEKDRAAVRIIPQLLDTAGYRIDHV